MLREYLCCWTRSPLLPNRAPGFKPSSVAGYASSVARHTSSLPWHTSSFTRHALACTFRICMS